MKKTTPLKVLNPLLFALAAFQIVSLPLMKFIGEAWMFEAHEIVGIGLGLTLVLHIFLNRAWIKSTYFPNRKKPSA